MERLLLEQNNEKFYTSHAGLALAGVHINRYSELGQNRSGGQSIKSNHLINIANRFVSLLLSG